MSTMTPTTGAVFVPEVWNKDAQMFREARLVLANLVERYDDRVKGEGDIIHIPIISELAVQQYTPGNDVTPAAPTENEVTITVDQFYTSMFEIDRTLGTQSKYDLAAAYKKSAGYAIAKKIDSTIAALYAGLSNQLGTTTGMTDALIVGGLEVLDTNDVPDEDRVLVIHPAAKADILLLDKFSLYINRGKDVVGTGKFGDLYGVPVYVSTNIVKVAGTPPVYKNLLFHKSAFGLAMQKEITWSVVESTYKFADVYKPLAMWGVAELRDNHAVCLTTA